MVLVIPKCTSSTDSEYSIFPSASNPGSGTWATQAEYSKWLKNSRFQDILNILLMTDKLAFENRWGAKCVFML